MRYGKVFVVAACFMIFVSCSPRIVTIYYNDTTKVDDGEIFGEMLHSFFVEDKNVHIYKVRSEKLNDGLLKIIHYVNEKAGVQEPDDSYYKYAFITASRDTLFADYRLNYWKFKEKGFLYNGEKIKPIIDSTIRKYL